MNSTAGSPQSATEITGVAADVLRHMHAWVGVAEAERQLVGDPVKVCDLLDRAVDRHQRRGVRAGLGTDTAPFPAKLVQRLSWSTTDSDPGGKYG